MRSARSRRAGILLIELVPKQILPPPMPPPGQHGPRFDAEIARRSGRR